MRLRKIVAARPNAIILREKDLCRDDYRTLAEKALEICGNEVRCILHTYADVARELRVPVHLPLPVLRRDRGLCDDMIYGASCHSVQDVSEAKSLGCNYVTLGHVFPTDCKKGVPARGTDPVKKAVEAVDIPVFAIGGIDRDNIGKIVDCGAKGACVMSGAFACDDVDKYFYELKKAILTI